MSKRVCHQSWQAALLQHFCALAQHLTSLVGISSDMRFLNQNKSAFEYMESKITLMLKGTCTTSPVWGILKFQCNYSENLHTVQAAAHLSPVEHFPPNKAGRDVNLAPMPQQFYQINKMCNNCFTSNSALWLQAHFIRLKLWDTQRRGRAISAVCARQWLDR